MQNNGYVRYGLQRGIGIFWGGSDRTVCDYGSSYKTICIYQNSQTCTENRINFTVLITSQLKHNLFLVF